MSSSTLNDLEEVAGEVYASEAGESVAPLSFEDFEEDFSNTVWMTFEVRGKKRQVEVLVTDQLQRHALSEVRRTDNESIREYEQHLLELAFVEDQEAIKIERDFLNTMSVADREERIAVEVKYKEYILLNFIVTPGLDSQSLSKVPQDVRDKMVDAYHKVNTPKAVLANVSSFRGVGRTSGEQELSGAGVSEGEE